jgi:hypothetical protein
MAKRARLRELLPPSINSRIRLYGGNLGLTRNARGSRFLRLQAEATAEASHRENRATNCKKPQHSVTSTQETSN